MGLPRNRRMGSGDCRLLGAAQCKRVAVNPAPRILAHRTAGGPMSPRTPMKVRGIRIPDKVWEAAMQASIERDENLSEEIRKFLEQYVAKAKREANKTGATK